MGNAVCRALAKSLTNGGTAARQIALAAIAASAFAATEAHAQTHRALLIGIGTYTAGCPEACPLPGAANDIVAMREILTGRFDFSPEHVRTLEDPEATREAILLAIRNLAETAAPDDVVYIHFSGHGSRVPDANGDEEDGFDETILPFDARTAEVPDITDDELNALISEFRSRNVIVVLDSCHSGTGTRSLFNQVTPRAAAPDRRTGLYDAVSPRGRVDISENHVLFTAAQDSQQELDGPFGPGRERMGLLTATLSAALEKAPRDVSPRRIIEEIDRRIEELKSRAGGYAIPEPNLEAPAAKHDAPLFGLGAIADGAAPPDAVSQRGDAASRFDDLFHSGAPETQSVFASLAESSETLDRNLAADIVEAAGQAFRIAEAAGTADVVVVASKDSPLQARTFDVYGPGGATLVAEGVGGPDVGGVVANAMSIAALVSINNPSPGSAFSLTVAGSSPVRTAATSTRAIRITANSQNEALGFYTPGSPRHSGNSLQLRVATDRDCFLTLASVDSKGNVVLLFPNVVQEERRFLPGGRIRANQPVLIPDSLQDRNAAGFHFDYGPPAGVDRLVGVCASDRRFADSLQSRLRQLEDSNDSDAAEDTGSGGPGGEELSRGSDVWASALLSLTVR